MLRAFGVLALGALWAVAQSPDATRRIPLSTGPRRMALVLGNDAYSQMPLRNAVNDANAIGAALEQLGFSVQRAVNTAHPELQRVTERFAAAVQPGDVALVYYAGHGIELEGENYLVPVDFDARDEIEAKERAYRAPKLLEKLKARGARVRVLILDACRNNPFLGRRAYGSGLGKMIAAEGEFIAFAAAPGATAADNPAGGNGLFTEHLIDVLRQPGLGYLQVFKQVRDRVSAASAGRQRPYFEDGIIGELYLNLREGPPDAGQPAQPAAAHSDSDAAALIDGAPLGAKELERAAAGRLILLEAQAYDLKKRALDELIASRVLEKEAAARGMDLQTLLWQEVDAKTAPVTDAEVSKVLEASRARGVRGATADQAHAYLAKQHSAARRDEFVLTLRSKYRVRQLLEPPRVDVAAAGYSRGPLAAPVTVVEFADFQCPYSARARATVAALLDRHQRQVRHVFRNFPLPIHPDAWKAAEAAACAGEQGRFWEMHDRLFGSQDRLKTPDLKQHASALGLDGTAFSRCLDSGRYEADVRSDLEAGNSYGVVGTPAFFINGRPLLGAQPLESFEEVVSDELQRKAAGQR